MKNHENPTSNQDSSVITEAPVGFGSNPGGDEVFRQFKINEQAFPTTDEERLAASGESVNAARATYVDLMAKRRIRGWSPRYKKKLAHAKEDYEMTRDNMRQKMNDIKRRSLYGVNVNKSEIDDAIVEDNISSALNEVELLSAMTWEATLKKDRSSRVRNFAHWWDRQYDRFFSAGVGLEEMGLNAAVFFAAGFVANLGKNSKTTPLRGGLSAAKEATSMSFKNARKQPRAKTRRENARTEQMTNNALHEARAIQEKVYATYRKKRTGTSYAGRSVITSDITDHFRENTHKLEKQNKRWLVGTTLGTTAVNRLMAEQDKKGLRSRLVHG